jgi:cytochrome c-type biogenesis protein
VESTVLKGVGLLAIYATGLALPFLLTAFTLEGFLSFYNRFQRHMHKLEIASGITMIALGLLVSTGHLVLLNEWLNNVPFFCWMAERFL